LHVCERLPCLNEFCKDEQSRDYILQHGGGGGPGPPWRRHPHSSLASSSLASSSVPPPPPPSRGRRHHPYPRRGEESTPKEGVKEAPTLPQEGMEALPQEGVGGLTLQQGVVATHLKGEGKEPQVPTIYKGKVFQNCTLIMFFLLQISNYIYCKNCNI